MQKVYRLALLCALMAPLSGCGGNTALTASSLCGDGSTPGAWQPITILKDDKITDRTSAKILQNNEARKVICKNKGAEHG